MGAKGSRPQIQHRVPLPDDMTDEELIEKINMGDLDVESLSGKDSVGRSRSCMVSLLSENLRKQGELSYTLHQLAQLGKTEIIQLKVRSKVDVNQLDEDQLSPLHYATRYNHLDTADLLLRSGAQVNICGQDDNTPLHFAARLKLRPDCDDEDPDEVDQTATDIPSVTVSQHDATPGHTPSRTPQHLATRTPAPPTLPTPTKISPFSNPYTETQGLTQPNTVGLTTSSVKPAGVPPIPPKTLDLKLSKPKTQEEAEAPGESMLRLLMRHGATPDVKNKYGQTPLHFAAMTGNLEAVRDLLECGAQAETEDTQQMTPVIVAATYGYADILQLLIDQARVNVRHVDTSKQSALHRAAKGGHLESVQLLINSGKMMKNYKSFLDARDTKHKTPLYHAASNGHTKVVELLLAEGADGEADNTTMATPLHAAASVGNVDLITLLHERSGVVDARDLHLRTPLMYAAAGDHCQAARTLVKMGANLEASDQDCKTPLMVAAQAGHGAMVATLLGSGANPRALDKFDRTAVFLAAEQCKLEALEELVGHDACKGLVDVVDCYGRPPLHVAVATGNMAVVATLLAAGADVTKKNEEQDTIMHLAAKMGFTSVVRELAVECRAMLDAENEDLNTPLHVACKFGHDDVVRVLLEAGADVGDKNASSATPLHLAAALGHVACCRLLLEHKAPLDDFNKDRKTPILLAVLGGHHAITRLLLDRGASLQGHDKNDMNVLEIAIHEGQRDVALNIVRSSSWEESLQRISLDASGNRITPFRLLIEKMPSVAEEVLDRCMVTKKISGEENNLHQTINFVYLDDTYQLKAGPSQFESRGQLSAQARPYTTSARILSNNHPLMLMVRHMRINLLAHPVCMHLIRQKWCNYGRFMYYSTLFLYMAFVVALTSYVILVRDLNWVGDSTSYESFNRTHALHCSDVAWAEQGRLLVVLEVLRWTIVALAGMEMLKETLQIYQAFLAYFGLENLLEWACYVTAVIFAMDFEQCPLKQDWQWQTGAASIFLAWMNLLLYIRVFPFFGIYVIMFTEVFKTFISFFLVFFLFIIAFALSFYTVLGMQFTFRTPAHSLLSTFVMMLGELNFNEIFSNRHDPLEYPEVTFILIMAFLVVMSIIIMNLLVGLAVDDIKAVQEQAMLQKLAMQAKLLMEVEMVIPDRIRRKYATSRLDVHGTRRSLLSWVLGKLSHHEANEVNEMEDLRREVLNLSSAVRELAEVRGLAGEVADIKAAVVDLAGLRDQIADLAKHVAPKTTKTRTKTKSIFRVF